MLQLEFNESDLKTRVLTTSIIFDENTCSLDLLTETAESFSLGLASARTIIKEVATAASSWREVARDTGHATPK
jgi:serine/threonine-protein kinase HipA